jgi:hypothetical protein
MTCAIMPTSNKVDRVLLEQSVAFSEMFAICAAFSAPHVHSGMIASAKLRPSSFMTASEVAPDGGLAQI